MHWGHFHPFGFFFFILLIGLLITNIILWRRRNSCGYYNSHIARATLDNRFAKGEITKDEYNDMKEIMKK